jgi:general secretion pathway protein E/type IV pilus assembly protein PilB
MNARMAEYDRTTPVQLQRLIPSPEACACLDEAAARRLAVVPLARWPGSSHDQLVVACATPCDQTVRDRLARQLPRNIRPLILQAEGHDINVALDRCYASADFSAQLISVCQSRSPALRVINEQPDFLVRLLDWILLCASRQRASDIHLSPESLCLHIRFRIDGVLRSFATLSSAVHSGLQVRMKILASMDIAESRCPQDGQFSRLIDAHDIDFRVSCFPTVAGQNTVLRLLHQQCRLDTLAGLQLPAATHADLASLVKRPDGLLVICGPTGSGKSTTLHALLNERDTASLNIMTLEDPVEQVLPGVRQSTIDAAHGLNYSQGVRALLRQDPDVLLIGEIRDTHSCAMALRAVMSGHQVLTTVHASSALAGLSRLRELGAMPAMLASNLVAIASQRLMRKRCDGCCDAVREARRKTAEDMRRNACAEAFGQTGCSQCHGTGYRGRQVIMELLVITPAVAAQVAADASHQSLLACALRENFVPLHDQGKRLVDQGISSSEELERVLGSRIDTVSPHSVQVGLST